MLAMLAASALAEVVRTPLEEAFGFRVSAALSLAVAVAVSYWTRRWLLALRGD